jgi:hypothetical protein
MVTAEPGPGDDGAGALGNDGAGDAGAVGAGVAGDERVAGTGESTVLGVIGPWAVADTAEEGPATGCVSPFISAAAACNSPAFELGAGEIAVDAPRAEVGFKEGPALPAV